MNMFLKSSVLLLCLSWSLTVFAQVVPDVKPTEVYAQQKQIANDVTAKTSLSPISLPDAKSMVSINQSGDGIINMPIVNVKGRKLSLPININYVTGGIKVDQTSSEVGLGWSISVGSITRDYGAYEPDYTYTGSEFKMLRDNGAAASGMSFDKKLKSTEWTWSAPASAWVPTSAHYFTPTNQNKILDYNNVDHDHSKAPDNYVINVPGLGSNDFWNSEGTIPAWGVAPPPPSFVFSDKVPWKVDYDVAQFQISQELSRINEFNYGETPSGSGSMLLRGDGANMAAAIALYPYVKNQQYSNFTVVAPSGAATYSSHLLGPTPSPYMKVGYEDYSKFTITNAEGTQYVFGRPLRGQKYLFSDEPFWSAMNRTQFLASGATAFPELVYNEFWKTDYIAEWLLTEVRSNDYVDVNGNGPDEADKGDWIKIEYTDPIIFENLSGLPLAVAEPRHREFLNFTQTDRQSSIWRERAYVTKIKTPIQDIDFTNSERFDVNHDYFKTPFNRIDNVYKYNCRYVVGASVGYSPGVDPVTGGTVAPTVLDFETCINYPIDLRRYDAVLVHDKAGNLVQNVKLNYAAKGSAQELAVSHHLILDNDKTTFNSYNPANLGLGLDQSNFVRSSGRGKTTLVGIDYRGSSTTSTNKLSYSFEYGYNPSYDDIHMHQIWQMAANPTIREALQKDGTDIDWSRWRGIRTFTIPGTTVIFKIPNSILPWKTVMIDKTSGASTPYTFSASDLNLVYGENWGNPVYEDELGYYYNAGAAGSGRHAWTLSKIGLPYGGSVQMQFERDEVDITGDRQSWKIPDFALPEVGHYNNLAHYRSALQQANNLLYAGGAPNLVRLYNEYYFMLNELSGGIRLKQIEIKDNFTASSITKSISYGAGHFTLPPPDYWANYIKGFGEFLQNEYKRHGNTDADGGYENYGTGTLSTEFSEYTNSMMRLNFSLRIDNGYKKAATHYYEFVDEVGADLSKRRIYYGSHTLLPGGRKPNVSMDYGVIKLNNIDRQNVVNILGSHLDSYLGSEIVNYKSELYNNLGQIVEQTENDYYFNIHNVNTISINEKDFIGRDYYPFIPYFDLTPPLGLHPVGIGGVMYSPFPSAVPHDLYSTGTSTMLTPYYTPSGSTFNSFGEAKDPILKLAVQGGIYTGLPSWFTQISTQANPWGTTTTPPSIVSAITNSFNLLITESNEMTDAHCYLRDRDVKMPSSAFSDNVSRELYSNHVKKIAKFY